MVAAAAGHPELSVSRTGGVGLCCDRVRGIPVGTPFLHVAVHIVQPEGIGRCLPHFQGDCFVVAGNDLVPAHGRRQPISRIITGIGTCPAGILPFCFGRQPVVLAFPSAEPFAVVHGILIGHIYHRFIVFAGDVVLAPPLLVFRAEGFVLRIGHFGDSHAKRVGESDRVDRLFVRPARIVLVTHIESACRNLYGGRYGR